MGVVESILVRAANPGDRNRDGAAQWQDELVTELSALIADVHGGRVDLAVLRREITKKMVDRSGVIDPEQLCDRVINRLFGYDWLQEYIEDPEVSDIDIPRFHYAMIKRCGVSEIVTSRFTSESEFERFCRLIIIRNGGVINEAYPHCRVADGKHKLRINVSIPPRNATGASLTIRKHREQAFSLEDLAQRGMFPDRLIPELVSMMRQKVNVLICGKGGSGKTTLLRALLRETSESERILICESDAEIYTDKANCIVQRISKRETQRDVNLNRLVEEGLTMSLDTYCIGEITGSEAWPFVKAGYSGHRVLATLHAMNSFESGDRLLMLCSEQSPLPEYKLREMIAKCVQRILYLEDFRIREIRSGDTLIYQDGEGEGEHPCPLS
ncbi:MAG: ATPase, T2SS/T4P/T4SS family [Bacillota bacterium]|nr:ATPase, T2SS/T4P/T4SS family [Bacillota bacterium]